jgi:RNA polymerase sigma factor (sigma-70 family)
MVDTAPTRRPEGLTAMTPMRPTFDELYRDRYRPMVRLAFVMVDTAEDAEQVVQDAFVGLYKRFDRVEQPAAYLRTSVVNGARKMLRRRRIMRRTPTDRPTNADLGFDHTFDAIRRLPAEQRVLVALRYEQQLSDSEIATALSVPIGTVKSRLHRAITTRREEIS